MKELLHLVCFTFDHFVKKNFLIINAGLLNVARE